jgi:hypothetical protein
MFWVARTRPWAATASPQQRANSISLRLNDSHSFRNSSISADIIGHHSHAAIRGFPGKAMEKLRNNFGRVHHFTAILAGAQVLAAVEAFEDALELGGYVFKFEILFVKLMVAVLAEPK